MKQLDINIEKLMQEEFKYAKKWWAIALICRFTIVSINATAVFLSNYAEVFVIIATLLTIVQPLTQWYSDRLKSAANNVLRKIEMFKGLDWEITQREISDLRATAPIVVKKRAEASKVLREDYFFSQSPPSPRHLLENLEESAWWTKHLARRMAFCVAVFSLAIISIAVIILVISLQSALNQNTADNIAKVIISVIAFVFSGGYVRLADDYNRLANAAERAEDKVILLKDKPDLTEAEAIKVVHDYHIIRSGSPLLPEWIWKIRRNELNKLWRERASSS